MTDIESLPTPPPGRHERPEDFTQDMMAGRFADDELAGRYRWAKGLGWLNWDGRRWRPCSDESVIEVARKWTLRHMFEAQDRVRRGLAEPALSAKWLKVSMYASHLYAIVRLAKGMEGVETIAAAFDAHPDLLNTANGVVDLRTGELRAHDPELLMTKLTRATYAAGASHRDWHAALQAIPKDCRAYAQLRYGQAITGHMSPDDVLLVQQGAGENGKSTVMGGIAAALGDYYTHVSDRVLTSQPGDHPTEFMDFRGARLALIEETPEARRLSVARLKKLVGTPTITARYIRQDSVTFEATHTLFLSTNYMPVIEETDHGTWRRLKLLRYPYRFRKLHEPLEHPGDRRGDPGLRRRIANDPAVSRAILSWLVDGAVAWHALERVIPEAPARIEMDTLTWRHEADLVLAYADDRLAVDPGAHVMATELLADFNTWLQEHGHRPLSDKVFASRFAGHDALAGQVEKRKVRYSDALCRRPTPAGWNVPLAPPPTTYQAWLGVRFRRDSDDADLPPSSTNTGGVPGVPSANHEPQQRPLIGVIPSTRNSRNTQQPHALLDEPRGAST